MKIHGTTTSADLAELHPLLEQVTAEWCLGNYRRLERFCELYGVDPYHIQVCTKARHVGEGQYLFFEMGGGDACAWVDVPPPEHVWGTFRPQAEQRVWHPEFLIHDIPKRGPWLYPLEIPEEG